MIDIKNLYLKFEDNIFFEDVELSLREHKINVILGPNGAGKTTVLKILTGLLKPDKVSEFGLLSKKIFYLPQKISYPKGLDVEEYISSVFFKDSMVKWFLTKEEKSRLDDIINKLGLSHIKNLSMEKLSAGELQKTNIAIGLLSGAEVFFLDEPTSNMDLINQIKILDMIKKLTEQKEITAVVILHDLNLAESYGDYFIGITKEHKIFCKSKEGFFTKDMLKNIYGINFRITDDGERVYVRVDK